MIDILLIVLPVFLVIGAGYGAVRAGLMADALTDALMSYATRIAVPVLLFTKLAALDLSAAFAPGMLIAFFAGGLSCFAIGLLLARQGGLSPPRAVVIGFAALFSNTVLLGLPVMTRAYGEAATEPMFGVIAFHSPLIYAIGMGAMAVSMQTGGGPLRAVRDTLLRLIGNALMIGIFLGVAVNLAGLTPPAPLQEALELLARSALPTALFALGAAMTRYKVRAELGWAGLIAGLSLMVHPAIAYGLGAHVFALDPPLLRAAVVAAAMPSGLNAYIFAALWREGEEAAASAVVLGTALAVLSVSFWLAVLGAAGAPPGA